MEGVVRRAGQRGQSQAQSGVASPGGKACAKRKSAGCCAEKASKHAISNRQEAQDAPQPRTKDQFLRGGTKQAFMNVCISQPPLSQCARPLCLAKLNIEDLLS